MLFVICLQACASLDTHEFIENKNQVYENIPFFWQTKDGSTLDRAATWELLFDDLILLNHLRTAERNNFDLQQVKINLEQSYLAVKQARTTLLPVINANGGGNVAALVRNLDNLNESFNNTLSLSWDPDIFGGRKAQLRQSSINQRIASYNTYNVRQQLMANVINLYISIIQSDLQVELSQKNLEFLKERLRIANAQYEAGRIGLDQAAFADSNYRSAVASLEEQKFTSRQLRRSFNFLLGRFDEPNIKIAKQLPVLKSLPKRDVPALVLHQRPDVKIAQDQINLALTTYKITVISDWPIFTITGSISSGGNLDDLFSPSSYIANLGASAFGNIYDGGLNALQRENLRLDIESALINYQNVLVAAQNNVEDIYDQSQVNQLQMESLIEATEAGDLALELEQIRFELGQSDLLSVLQVQQSALSNNAALINIKAALATTRVNAYLATGGDLDYGVLSG